MFENLANEISGDQLVDIGTRLLLIILIIVLTGIAQRLTYRLMIRLVDWVLRTTMQLRKIDVPFEENLSHKLVRPVKLLIVVLGLRLALALLILPAFVANLADHIAVSIITLVPLWVLYHVVDATAQYLISVSRLEESPLDETIVRFGRHIAIFVIFIFAIVFILQRWGQDVGALVAGLGIASLAIALAAQDALSNIIAYFAVIADAPFKVGDFVVIDGLVRGRIQEISFRSTRIRTIENAVMVIPNQTIANASVVNWARVRKRRVDMIIGLTYSSTPTQIESVIGDIRDMLAHHEHVIQERIVVEFVEFGESSLNVRVTFLAKAGSWEDLEAVKTDINLKLMHLIENRKLSIAFPTRTLYVANNNDEATMVNEG
jgi:MscS family membrane protein